MDIRTTLDMDRLLTVNPEVILDAKDLLKANNIYSKICKTPVKFLEDKEEIKPALIVSSIDLEKVLGILKDRYSFEVKELEKDIVWELIKE